MTIPLGEAGTRQFMRAHRAAARVAAKKRKASAVAVKPKPKKRAKQRVGEVTEIKEVAVYQTCREQPIETRSKREGEAAFQKTVIAFARLHGWRYYFTFNSKKSPPGFPDLTLVRPSRIVFAELKTETGKPTDEQCEWLMDLATVAGVEVYLWRPSDWTEIEQALKR